MKQNIIVFSILILVLIIILVPLIGCQRQVKNQIFKNECDEDPLIEYILNKALINIDHEYAMTKDICLNEFIIVAPCRVDIPKFSLIFNSKFEKLYKPLASKNKCNVLMDIIITCKVVENNKDIKKIEKDKRKKYPKGMILASLVIANKDKLRFNFKKDIKLLYTYLIIILYDPITGNAMDYTEITNFDIYDLEGIAVHKQ